MSNQQENMSTMVIVIAGLVVMICGIAVGWFVNNSSSKTSVTITADKVLEMHTPTNTFAASVFDHIPEAYREYSYFGVIRDQNGLATPHEARLYVAARLFGEEFKATEGILDNVSRGYNVDERTLTRGAIPERLEAIAKDVLPLNSARCPNFKVGPVRNIRNPDWHDTRVRELKIELHIGC